MRRMPEGESAVPGRVLNRMPRWLKVCGVLVVCGTLIAIGFTLRLRRPVSEIREVRLADGSIVRLERYEFRSETVRYHQAEQPMAQAVWNSLPKDAKKKINPPGATAFVTPDFPNEPVLSAAFSAHDASGKRQDGAGTRIVVLDDRGQRFDAVMNSAGSSGVFEAVAFPRRGRQLTLRLMDGEKLLADFKIANPCPGSHPVWKATRVGVITNGTLEVSMEKFVADVARQRTRCTFRVRERGQDSSAYRLARFEISDATGNHWRALLEQPAQATNGWITATLFGALWPEEEAWKLRVEFRPADKDSANQTAHIVEFLAKPEQVTPTGR